MRFRWQNLNDKPGNQQGSILRNGRAWLHIGRYTLGWQWVFFKPTCHLQVGVRPDSESTLSASAAVPGFAFYLHLDTPWGHRLANLTRRKDGSKYGTDRHIGVRIFDWAIWWDMWADGMEWRAKDPKWMHGAFHPIDFLLGRYKFSERLLEERIVRIPMPECAYPATAKLTLAEWRRPRWPFPARQVRADIEIEGGIPVPGKGENSWDCDEDAIFGHGCKARTIEEAIASVVESALSTRRRHGGNNWRPERRSATA